MTEGVTVHLYGPVRVRRGGVDVPVGGPRERAVLAALALAVERPVSVDRLVAWLWDDAPPARARKSVQNAVMLLRRALTPLGVEVERQGDGYVLRPGEAVLDTAAPGAGEPLELLGQGADIVTARARLVELRLAALERDLAQRMTVDPGEPMADLLTLTGEHPYREPLWALLVQCHYRAGHQHEALSTYRRAREVLLEGTGLEPGLALQEIHRAVLAQDPALRVDRAATARAWLAEGSARAAMGDVADAREAYARAVEAARDADDDLLLADAAAALGGDAQWLVGDAELEALAEATLARLGEPPRDPVRAGRLRTTLALARSTRADPRARADAAEAARLTAEGATPGVRTAALFALAGTREGPDDVAARRRHGTMLVEHGRAHDDAVAVALGQMYLGWVALEYGDGIGAAAARQAMLTAAAGSPHPHLAAQVADTRFLGAILDGRLDDALEGAGEIGSAWRRSADPAFAWFLDLCARVFVLELTDGLDILLPELEHGRAVAPHDPLFPLLLALAHGLAGRLAEAGSCLDQARDHDLRAFPRQTLWPGWVSGMGWIADLTDRGDLASVVLDLLRPLEARHLVLGGMHYRGAVAHWQGVCHRVLGDHGLAAQHLRQALHEHDQLGVQPWVALSAEALARTLAEAGDASSSRDEVDELIARATTLADELGMSVLAARCRGRRAVP